MDTQVRTGASRVKFQIPNLGRPQAAIGNQTNATGSYNSVTPPLDNRRPIGGSSRDFRADTPPNQDGDVAPPPPIKSAPPAGIKQPKPSRLTEVYDNILDAYTQPAPPMPTIPEESNRIQAWALDASAAPPPSALSLRVPSSYGGTNAGAPSKMRGTGTSRYTPSRNTSRVASTYEDGGRRSTELGKGYEIGKIRVKIHYKDDIRGMTLDPQLPFEDFLDKLVVKFNRGFNSIYLCFKDEDGGRVTIRDESDYELAIEVARESAKGRSEGRLEVWCDDC